ncbi:MAG: hypothetical protein IJ599_05115 [Alphaproteobacteria bacterium]|nr:hypothetical protein [Alphaproteobacteria bacterium]
MSLIEEIFNSPDCKLNLHIKLADKEPLQLLMHKNKEGLFELSYLDEIPIPGETLTAEIDDIFLDKSIVLTKYSSYCAARIKFFGCRTSTIPTLASIPLRAKIVCAIGFGGFGDFRSVFPIFCLAAFGWLFRGNQSCGYSADC